MSSFAATPRRPTDGSSPEQTLGSINVVTDFFSELTRLAPPNRK